MSAAKLPPHSIEAEQSVIGGLLAASTAYDRVADTLTETDFYRQDHRLIYRAASALADSSEPIDVVSLTEGLRNAGLLEKAGGASYIGNLAADIPSAANIKAYAEIVRDRSIKRRLLAVSDEIAASAYSNDGSDAATQLAKAESSIYAVGESGQQSDAGPRGANALISELVDEIESLTANPGALSGLSTGFEQLDEMLGGLQSGDLFILAARPSMGKTSLAMNIAENVAISGKTPAAVFSLEMPARQLMRRLTSSRAGVDQARINRGELSEDDWSRISATLAEINAANNLFIDDTGGLSPTQMRTRARRLKREHDIGLIVVDYLQLMQVPGTKENRTNEISEISRQLKAMAKELNVPVIALSQLNRQVEQRDDKRPRMSDLRESGGIEQDADVITFVYRDEVYNEDSTHAGVAEIIIGKQRNGPVGTAELSWRGDRVRFGDYEGPSRREREPAPKRGKSRSRGGSEFGGFE